MTIFSYLFITNLSLYIVLIKCWFRSIFLYVCFLYLKVDLDLGNYERFLDLKLTRDNNITTGKIYQVLILYSAYALLVYRISWINIEVSVEFVMLYSVDYCSLLSTRRGGEITWARQCRFVLFFFLENCNKAPASLLIF